MGEAAPDGDRRPASGNVAGDLNEEFRGHSRSFVISLLIKQHVRDGKLYL